MQISTDFASREEIIRQQQQTPKLHTMFPGASDARDTSANPLRDNSRGLSFWEDIGKQANHHGESSALETSAILNQSIVEELGSAQEITNQIQNPYYAKINTKINESLILNDYSINGGDGANDSSMLLGGIQPGQEEDESSQMIYPSSNSAQNQEPDMIPDELAENCYKCKSEFNFFFRRHHCQICRKVFCKNCSVQTNLPTADGEPPRRLRTCKKCKELHGKYSETLQLQKSLLSDKISHQQRRAESVHFSGILSEEKPTTPMNIERADGPEFLVNSANAQNPPLLDDTLQLDSSKHARHFSMRFSDDETAQSASQQHPKPAGNNIAQLSASNRHRMSNYLQHEKRTESLAVTGSNRVTDKRTNDWLNHKLRSHLDSMIDMVISQHKIEPLKWRKILANCTKHAVMTIRPSSRMLSDSIDFNSFIKIVTIQHHNQEKCQYINGVVFKKDVASRKMRTQIENPRILLLHNSLGYVQEDEGMSDMQAEISQQTSFVKIIRQKILSVKPHIIFIEKDASRLALETCLQDNITVVTVTSAKMLKMIARATQTIVCPSTNLLERNFVVGYCLSFRVEQIKPIIQKGQCQNQQSLSETTSLMFLEGCQAKLGCSIVISGPDLVELKQVRHALKACLKTARILLLERELFRFFMPEIQNFRKSDATISQQQNQAEQQNHASHEEERKGGAADQEPELTFQSAKENQNDMSLLDHTSTSMLRGNSLASATGDAANDELIDSIYDSPYLFAKHMQRDELVFEMFSLAQGSGEKTESGSGKSGPAFEIHQNKKMSPSRMKQSFYDKKAPETTQNRLSGDSDSSGMVGPGSAKSGEVMNEAVLRKKLQNMCKRPMRRIVKFLHEDQDMSLFTFLSRQAHMYKDACKEESCGKPLNQHTKYWYHNDGCVEIKTTQATTDLNPNQPQGFETPTVLHCYCNECQRNVFQKERIPDQMLEMSFTKLMEQFFYNRRVSVSKIRDQDVLPGDPTCSHSLFGSCELIFRFGAVKTTIKFEHLDAYSLDMFHFGLQKGSVTEEEKLSQIAHRLDQLQLHMFESYTWMLGKVELLFSFMDVGMDEIKRLTIVEPSELDQATSQIINFLLKYKKSCSDFFKFTMQEIFGEDIDPTNPNLHAFDNLDRRIAEEQISSVRQKGKAAEIKTLMQFNRLHKILSARACEYLYILRQCVSLVKNEIITSCLPKKNPFSELDTHLNTVLNNASSQVQSAMEKQIGGLIGLDAAITGSIPVHKRGTSLEDSSAASFSRDGTTILQATQNAKTVYKELSLFEHQLKDCRYIADLVEQNVFIPAGFNSNATELVKLNLTSKKKTMDLASVIASAMSSNLYLNGLAYLDYLNMQSLIKPFNGKFIQSKSNGGMNDHDAEIMMAAAKDSNSSRVQLSQDVLNDTVPLESVEQELLGITSNAFKISFSTHQPLANLEVLVDTRRRKQIYGYGGDGENKEFYSHCETIADLSSIEMPLGQLFFDDLINLYYTVQEVSKTSRIPSAKRRNPSNGQESDFNNSQKPGSKTITRASTTGSQLKRGLTSMNRSSGGQKDYAKLINHEAAYRDIYHIYHEKIDFFVKIFCPKQFEALRKLYCGPYNEFLHSVFRSEVWKDNSGGKSASTFFKSFDNKYVLKGVESKEIKMFNDMSQSYFEYLSRSFTHQCPTAIAKVLGIYQIQMKRGKHSEHYCVLLMENLMLGIDEQVSIKYDLKGSRRNRYIPRTKQQAVTLDNNFLDDRKSRPIPMMYAMKKIMKIAIANDSMYLTKHSIIDYSMFVIINPVTKTVRLGIIDYIQQYTLEKELESYLKQTISNEDPTIIPPEQYKHRFRTAMDKYFIALVPDKEDNMKDLMEHKFQAEKIEWPTKKCSETSLMQAMKAKIQNLVFASREAEKDNQSQSQSSKLIQDK